MALAGCTHLTAGEKGSRTDPTSRLPQTSASPWREDFGDSDLATLLARADAGSLGGKLARSRLAKADAEVEAADAVRTINVVAGLSAAIGGATFHDSGSAATPTLEVRNELDVWGRLAHGRQSARAERAAAAADVDAARLQVGAETARSYLMLAAAREAHGIAMRREAAARDAQAFSERRLASGAANVRDVVARRSAVIAAAGARERAAAHADLELARLSDLIGAPVDVPVAVSGLAAPGLDRALGPVDSSVVDRRPDVRATQSRIRAADEHRAAAIAAARPQFQIAAAFGAPDAAIATLLDVRALAWAAAASLSHEILDGGARKARIHVATADADIADITYRQTVLVAWQEIRAAVADTASARRSLEAAVADLDAARAALSAAEARHAAGVVDGAGLAAARLTVADAEQAVCDARLRLGFAQVALILAEGPA
ncbi:MAG: TolC family protein [Phenylobacterium sp.]|uniref:TolC family protein n=1 Tax=Phenylobacterium sp. TaxID=1871053 RepID=UPI0025E5212F|nr:TolC family protein [Phenylobacterium sp.]MBT9470837.1 TolC family protein [Phenylobacterium sp.]